MPQIDCLAERSKFARNKFTESKKKREFCKSLLFCISLMRFPYIQS